MSTRDGFLVDSFPTRIIGKASLGPPVWWFGPRLSHHPVSRSGNRRSERWAGRREDPRLHAASVLSYSKAARVAKRPIDLYNARLGSGVIASMQRKRDLAVQELSAAAQVVEVGDTDRDFARELLGNVVKPPEGAGPVQRATDPLPRTKDGPSSAPK